VPTYRRPVFPVLVTLVAVAVPLQAQVAGPWSECRPDSLATWNCARYYEGTVTLAAELKDGAGNVISRRSITATVGVAGGRVSCRVTTLEVPQFEAPAILVVEHRSAGTVGGAYEIRVWCPEAGGERLTRDDYPVIEILNQRAANYNSFEGLDSYDHPDADEANQLTGTETVSWSLTRR
jgi:hypothetical protein